MELMPTVDSSRPINILISPLTTLFPISTLTRQRERNVIPKYSHGPNLIAIFVRDGAMSQRAKALNSPPIKEPKVPMARASAACPFWHMGYPSKVVAMAAAVPGIRRRMADTRPPEIPPI